MKDFKNVKQWFNLASQALTTNEYKVFTVWFLDSESFSSGATLIHQYLPKIKKTNIRRALRGLEKKGFLIRSSLAWKNKKGSPTPTWVLGDIDQILVNSKQPLVDPRNLLSKMRRDELSQLLNKKETKEEQPAQLNNNTNKEITNSPWSEKITKLLAKESFEHKLAFESMAYQLKVKGFLTPKQTKWVEAAYQWNFSMNSQNDQWSFLGEKS